MKSPTTPSGQQPRPPRVNFVLAVCAALGAAGFSMGMGGLLSWNEPIPEMPAMELPAAPPGEEESWERVEEAWAQLPAAQGQVLQAHRPALGALAAVNALASGVLFYGALSARIRRRNGLSSLRAGLVLSQAYAFLAAIVQTRMQLAILGAQRPILMPLVQEGGTVHTVAMAAVMVQGVATVLTAGLLVAQLLFYVWVQRWSRRPEIELALGPLA